MKNLKRSKNVFDYTTEELDLYDLHQINKLSTYEYAIFKWGRGNKVVSSHFYIFIFLSGTIIGFFIGVSI